MKVNKLINIIVSDKFYVCSTFSTLVCYGMFWTIPGALIYEIKANINEGMRVFGYLMTLMRIGKFIGHLIIIKTTNFVNPKNYPEIHLISMGVKCVGTILIPFCSGWIPLSFNWFFTGITLGVIESNMTFINTIVNGKSAPKYTNMYYFCFSLGAAITTYLVNGTKHHVDNPKKELSIVCWVVAAINLTMNTSVYAVVFLRRKRGIYLGVGEKSKSNPESEKEDTITGQTATGQTQTAIGETASATATGGESFKRPIISNVCLVLTSFCFMCARTILEVFLLPFAQKSHADLSEQDSYFVIQSVFISSMTVRFAGVFLAFYYTKTSVVLLLVNINMILGIGSLFGFKDFSLEGILISMILFGMVMGSFQNSLLNWMSDRMSLNPINTAPFFIATSIGSILTPAVTPYLIKNDDGSINLETYQTMVLLLFVLAAVFCGALMAVEQLQCTPMAKNNMSFVETIQIVPETVSTRETAIRLDLIFNDDVSIFGVAFGTSRSRYDSEMTVFTLSPEVYIRPRTTVSSFGHLTPIL